MTQLQFKKTFLRYYLTNISSESFKNIYLKLIYAGELLEDTSLHRRMTEMREMIKYELCTQLKGGNRTSV